MNGTINKRQIKPELRNAIYIGTLCAVSYLAVYFARNILGAVTPQTFYEHRE